MHRISSEQALERYLRKVNQDVVSCERCTRLRAFCKAVSRRRKQQFRDWDYWGKPVPGFGDPLGRLFIVGLAPAAHGGNRTGRMFTGDSSGDWLIQALFETGFANQPKSVSRDDGLELKDAYITATLRCAPPRNRPHADEVMNCYEYIRREFTVLPRIRVTLALGRVAFATCVRLLRERGVRTRVEFGHGFIHYFGPGIPTLVCSFHPSRQNTQTGRLKWENWISIFRNIRELLDAKT